MSQIIRRINGLQDRKDSLKKQNTLLDIISKPQQDRCRCRLGRLAPESSIVATNEFSKMLKSGTIWPLRAVSP